MVYTKDASACREQPKKRAVKDSTIKTLVSRFLGNMFVGERDGETGDLLIYMLGDTPISSVSIDSGATLDRAPTDRRMTGEKYQAMIENRRKTMSK